MERLQKAIFALGSNLGDRLTYLEDALQALMMLNRGESFCSSIWETPPMGPKPQAPYLNVCLSLATVLEPLELLEHCKGIERNLGRRHRRRWDSREIDVDILGLGDGIFTSPTLRIPHPHLAERQFVLAPLSEIEPGWTPPGMSKKVTELLKDCIDEQGPDLMTHYNPVAQVQYAIP